MLEKNIKEAEDKQKAYAKAYMILCLIIAVSVTTYTILKAREYITINAGIELNNKLIEALKADTTTEKAAYETSRAAFDELAVEIEKKLKSIFPEKDDYTALTRQIDKLEEDLNRIGDPFEISNIDFMDPKTEGNYAILPFRMNIRASGENFTKFLHTMENSGALNDGLRLMDVSSIRLSFAEEGGEGEGETGATKIITFSVLINAYFQGAK